MRYHFLSVDGNYCLTGGADKSLKLWNPNRGALLKNYMGHGYEVCFDVYRIAVQAFFSFFVMDRNPSFLVESVLRFHG